MKRQGKHILASGWESFRLRHRHSPPRRLHDCVNPRVNNVLITLGLACCGAIGVDLDAYDLSPPIAGYCVESSEFGLSRAGVSENSKTASGQAIFGPQTDGTEANGR